MSATTTHTSHPTNEADVPSALPEAHQKAYAGEVGCAIKSGWKMDAHLLSMRLCLATKGLI